MIIGKFNIDDLWDYPYEGLAVKSVSIDYGDNYLFKTSIRIYRIIDMGRIVFYLDLPTGLDSLCYNMFSLNDPDLIFQSNKEALEFADNFIAKLNRLKSFI